MPDENKHRFDLPGMSEEDLRIKARMAKIKHKILILSGKGGVGKSTVATNLAFSFAKTGKTGLLDIDINGPSIGRMTGIEGTPLIPVGDYVEPVDKDGVKIVTMASLLASPDQPVIWRGPMKMRAIKQFLSDIEWGDLDWLVIDSPPGTGDEPLSVCQLIPDLTGAIIVSTPQDIALLDARKTIEFARSLGVRVLGIIENMSGFVCPHCNKITDIFKTGGAQKSAIQMNVPFLGKIPLEPSIMDSGESGNPIVVASPESETAKIFADIAKRISE
jgi:ATP-binding protein involved in chromosome partitioning